MRTTIKDIAELANVSIATVSKVINGKDSSISKKTREKIKRIIEEENYIPNSVARTLVTKQSYSLGMIVPDICNPFFSQLIRGVEEDANKKGYDLIITNTDDDDEKLLVQLELMKKKMVDGLILISSQNSSIGEILDDINIPTVLVDRVVEHRSLVGRVEIDNKKGGSLATSHLIEKGCKKIVFLAGDIQTFSSYQRYLGYKSALEDHGLKFDETLVEFGSFHSEFGYNAVLSLLGKKCSFDGIYASNDMIAVGAMQALKSCGYRIPEDIKVIGFDDIYLSALVTPTLTTIHQPVFEMGSTASRILIDYLSNKTKSETPVVCFDTRLIERESTR